MRDFLISVVGFAKTEGDIKYILSSLHNQSIGFENIQIIINKENDSELYSSEQSGNIVYLACKDMDRIQILNRNFEMISGNYLCFFDENIIYPIDYFEKFLTRAEERKIEIAYTPVKYDFYEIDASEYYCYGNEPVFELNPVREYRISLNCPGAFLINSDLIQMDYNELLLIDRILEKTQRVTLFNECRLLRRRSGNPGMLQALYELIQKKNSTYLQYSAIREVLNLAYANTDSLQEKTDTIYDLVCDIMKKTDRSVLINGFGMQDMSRVLFFYKLKYGHYPRYTKRGNDILFGNPIRPMCRMSYQSVVLHFIDIIDNNMLVIEGETSIPEDIYKKASPVMAYINGGQVECTMLPQNRNKLLFGRVYEVCQCFRLEVRLEDRLAISFFHQYGRTHVDYKSNTCMRFAPVSNEILKGYARRKDYILKCRNNLIICEKADKEYRQQCEAEYTEEIANERIARFRRYYFYLREKKKKSIWLFFDRVDKADDNGEAMFNYVRANYREKIEAYFVIDRTSPDYERLKPLGNIVAAHSIKHKLIQVLADYILSSQANGFTENPFAKDEIYFRDLLHQPRVVFLQHGITKDNQTRWLNRYNQNLYSVVVSCKKEYESMLEYDYYYDSRQIWLTGMPRFDRLYHNEQKKILIMPTWRKSIMELAYDTKLKSYMWTMKSGYEESEYFRRYSELLSDEELIKTCKRYGYGIIFMPHPQTQPYVEGFDMNEEIETYPYKTAWRDIFAISNLMITDYSSVAFDFAYLRKPVLYYQFDRKEFFKGHTYSEGYFEYDRDGFGEVTDNLRELKEYIIDYVKNNCTIKEKYEARINDFYAFNDRNNCKRIYDKIILEEK